MNDPPTLLMIIERLTEVCNDVQAASWLGMFDFDLRGRPIVLCLSDEGRCAVFERVEAMHVQPGT